MSGYIGAQHEFHDAAFVQGWADRFVPSPPRIALFDLIREQICNPGLPNAHVLELGLGPGYMARHILQRDASLSYEGLDFSEVFFEVARKTIGAFMSRVTLTKADLMDQNWPEQISKQPGAIISTWALHDLGSQRAVADVYARCYEMLPKGGVLVNGDFIKPDGTTWTYEPGRFETGRHLELLRQAGFADPILLASFEINTDTPTSAQNYACLMATR
jgi:cyclopropane fatty-acyl-phospholipid synthase-like methyltransferase